MEVELHKGIASELLVLVVIAGKEGFDYLIRDPGAGAAKGLYALRELGSKIEALRFYEPLPQTSARLDVQR